MAVYNMTFSLSVNLHCMPETIAQEANACEVTKKTIRFLFVQAACIAVSRSYRIFNSRTSPDWDLSVCLN